MLGHWSTSPFSNNTRIQQNLRTSHVAQPLNSFQWYCTGWLLQIPVPMHLVEIAACVRVRNFARARLDQWPWRVHICVYVCMPVSMVCASTPLKLGYFFFNVYSKIYFFPDNFYLFWTLVQLTLLLVHPRQSSLRTFFIHFSFCYSWLSIFLAYTA